MSDKLVMGIDSGTSSIKVALFDIHGNKVCSCAKKNIIKNKDNNYEQDMELLWTEVCDVIKELIHKNSIDASNILSIGIAGQGEGCWLIDKYGKPVRNAILWSDGRANDIVAETNGNKDIKDEIRRITGSVLFAGASTAIMMWLKKYEPESLKKAEHFMFCKDWLRFKLTGLVGMEVTDASTSLLNLKDKTLSKDLFEILNIKECMDLIPQISNSCDLSGTVNKEVEELTGLKEGTPVVYGMMDISAAAIGMGAVNAGDCCTLIGTTICNEVIRKDYKFSDESTSGYEIYPVKDLCLNVIAPMAGTRNLDWVINNLFKMEKEEALRNNVSIYKLLEEKIKDIPSGARGVIYLPYISSSGERAPFYDCNARAEFFGLSENTDKYCMLKAVYEGIAFAIKDCIKDIEGLNKIYLGGGGSESMYLAKLLADCTGKEIIIPYGNKFTAKGAAIAAGVYSGLYKDMKEAVKSTSKVKKSIKPDIKNTKKYEELYNLYKLLREMNKEPWKIRRNILKKYN
ncbi:FGGY-family carbohydrate kinase [Clostridium sediminicola]|uniref:FGGY-family carbohydrate kinase n=1 Tax=Clostridium sediminicola TaxID=3114879 RepID=UPI0031F239D6